MPCAQSLSAWQGLGRHDLYSTVVQSLGSGAHSCPGAQAFDVQVEPPLTWQVQPFTQSESALQVL
jgi:hypothetical protein